MNTKLLFPILFPLAMVFSIGFSFVISKAISSSQSMLSSSELLQNQLPHSQSNKKKNLFRAKVANIRGIREIDSEINRLELQVGRVQRMVRGLKTLRKDRKNQVFKNKPKGRQTLSRIKSSSSFFSY